jgi:hypothetical protein
MSGRLALTLALTMWAGCFVANESGADLSPGDDDQGFETNCTTDDQCTLAGPSCCECPTFALGTDSRWDDACEQVECPLPAACPDLVARCEGGQCVATCAPMSCDLSCPGGFAVDSAGCTVCACGQGPAVPECGTAADCVQVPADCCGCARGGSDTAVPLADADSFVGDLMCAGDEACPGVSTCEANAMVACTGGRCVLENRGATPPDDGECGRPDQPPCPEGLECVINAAGSEAGAGHCQPPTP